MEINFYLNIIIERVYRNEVKVPNNYRYVHVKCSFFGI